MKRIILLVICILPLGVIYSQSVKIMSFNIRYDTPNDGENKWDLRKDLVIQNIKNYKSDFIGLQEVLNKQLKYINSKLSDKYNVIARGRGVRPEQDEALPIYYIKSKWTLLNYGHFWLSETPNVPASKSWGTACCRMAAWGFFQENGTDKQVVVVNTHLDHVSVKARVNGVKLIVEEIKKFGYDTPSILMGDFNAEPTSEVYKTVVTKTNLIDIYHEINNERKVADNTFRGWNSEKGIILIDYIFTTKPKKINKVVVDKGIINGKHTSDHFPIFIDIEF